MRIPVAEEQFKPPSEREFASRYQTQHSNPFSQQVEQSSEADYIDILAGEQFKQKPFMYQPQHSVPFGRQEQSSDIDREKEKTEWDVGDIGDKLELVHLPDPDLDPESSPNSFRAASTPHIEEHLPRMIEPALYANSQNPPEFSPNNQSTAVDSGETHPVSSRTSDLGSLPVSSHAQPAGVDDKDHPDQGSLRADSGQTNPGSSRTSDLSNLAVSSQAQPVGRNKDRPDQGSSRADISLTASTANSDQHIRIPSAEKVPVERVMSINHDAEVALHLHQKCPVEMSYNCITKYFIRGETQLGKGGFGIVYEGIVAKLQFSCLFLSLVEGGGDVCLGCIK